MSGGKVVAWLDANGGTWDTKEEAADAWMADGEPRGLVLQSDLAAAIARAEAAPVAVLLALADQFDGMADAAYNDCEYDRRDVWRNAAQQARYRAKDASWQAAIAAQQAEGEDRG